MSRYSFDYIKEIYRAALKKKSLQKAVESGKRVNGVIGPSPLMVLTDFDYVRAQVPDYLHSVCHGTIKTMMHLWTHSSFSKEPWHLDKENRAILNERLLKMKPPYEVTRTSRSLFDFAHWKATEFRSFALYYFSCLEDLLPTEYFQHFLCFVYGIQVLNQEEVKVERVHETKPLFHKFLQDAARLYGEEYVSFNFHLGSHLTDKCLDWGCLWATSTFIPEGVNGDLVRMFNGTQNVVEQMAKNFLLKKELRNDALSILSNNLIPHTASTMLRDLLNIPTPAGFNSGDLFTDIGNGIKFLGRPKTITTSDECQRAIQKYARAQHAVDSIDSFNEHNSYQRLQLSKQEIFTTSSYTRSPKRINYCAFMKDGSFFLIEKIILFRSLPTEKKSIHCWLFIFIF